ARPPAGRARGARRAVLRPVAGRSRTRRPHLQDLLGHPRSSRGAPGGGGGARAEKQGGSDVRANTTRARALGHGGPGAEYEMTGHKWFCSAPMCDAFLVLAQAERGLSCFLLPL